MESWDDLTTGLHPFVLSQHMATVRKFLHGQADRYAMVASGAGAPSLANVRIFLAPDGVTLPRNFSMARGLWLRTRLIVGTCFGVDHNASEGLREFGEEMSARETELEEYVPRDSTLLPLIPVLLLWHTQTSWSNWLTAQPTAVGSHLPHGAHPQPRSRLGRRHELTANPRTEPHGPMDPLGDLGRPRSDVHSNGGANLESRTG